MGGHRYGATVSLPGMPPDGDEWASCYCCGRFYLASNMVRFDCHPGDTLCVGCVAWLHDRSRTIIRKLYPIWRWPAFVRAWLSASLPAAGTAGGQNAGSSPQLSPPQAG
jgi:hypothetical protein